MLGWGSPKQLNALELLRRLRSDNQPLKLSGSRPKSFQYYLSLYAVPAVFGGLASSQTSTSWHKEAVLDAQTFRTLLRYQAVALLSISGHAWDDIVNMLAVYV